MKMTPREIMAACDVAAAIRDDEQRDLLRLMAIATHDPKQAAEIIGKG
jgi:hypothetical protein